MKPAELYGPEYASRQVRRGRLRRAVRGFYLRNILAHVRGASVDLGCGRGDLLSLLPAGSLGLDVNQSIVDHCVRTGLTVRRYDPDEDRYRFRELAPGAYATLLMVHVLEHIHDPGETIETVGASCARLGMQRIIAVVPGPRGFAHDLTHRVFLDRSFFEKHGRIGGFTLAHREYFPLNFSWAGNIFTHNEMVVLYDREP